MGTHAWPETIEKANRLSTVLDGPVMASECRARLSGLVGDDDLDDRLADAVRDGEPDADVSHLIADKLLEWTRSPEIFAKPWEPEALEIVRRAAEAVVDREDARMRSSSRMK